MKLLVALSLTLLSFCLQAQDRAVELMGNEPYALYPNSTNDVIKHIGILSGYVQEISRMDSTKAPVQMASFRVIKELHNYRDLAKGNICYLIMREYGCYQAYIKNDTLHVVYWAFSEKISEDMQHLIDVAESLGITISLENTHGLGFQHIVTP